jgi:antirestriction protein
MGLRLRGVRRTVRYAVPENLRFYIDHEALCRDLFIDGCFSIWSSDSGAYVFNSF